MESKRRKTDAPLRSVILTEFSLITKYLSLSLSLNMTKVEGVETDQSFRILLLLLAIYTLYLCPRFNLMYLVTDLNISVLSLLKHFLRDRRTQHGSHWCNYLFMSLISQKAIKETEDRQEKDAQDEREEKQVYKGFHFDFGRKVETLIDHETVS